MSNSFRVLSQPGDGRAPKRRWRRLGLAVILAVSAIIATRIAGPLASYRAADAATNAPSALPDEGMYDSCPPVPGATWGTSSAPCNANANLDALAPAGFKLVMNYDLLAGNLNQINSYLNHAAAVGMKVMIGLQDSVWWNGNARNAYSALSSGCRCSTNAAFATYIVNSLKTHPATWGYYVGEEVPSSEGSAAHAHWERIKAADPQKPTFIVSAEDEATLGSAMKAVGNSPGASVLAPDIYPIGRTDNPSTDPIWSVGQTVANVRDYANSLGKQTGAVLQSFNWKKMYPAETWLAVARFPTRDEMRRMRDDAISHGAHAFILWYSYFDLRLDVPWQQHWDDLRWAALGP